MIKKKKFLLVLLPIVILLIVFFGDFILSRVQNLNLTPSKWSKYTNENYGFEMDYPYPSVSLGYVGWFKFENEAWLGDNYLQNWQITPILRLTYIGGNEFISGSSVRIEKYESRVSKQKLLDLVNADLTYLNTPTDTLPQPPHDYIYKSYKFNSIDGYLVYREAGKEERQVNTFLFEKEGKFFGIVWQPNKFNEEYNKVVNKIVSTFKFTN